MDSRHLLAGLAAALVAPLALASPAAASTGGTPDGERHPQVGLLVSYTDEGRYRCSGTLVSPTVVLTAAHCTDGVDGQVALSLESVIASAAPSPLPVEGIAPASIAELPKTLITAVGYGTEVRTPESGPRKPQPMTYPLIRRFVDMPGQKLTPQILQTNGNPHDTRGTGGTCFGDSGGPVFLRGEIVAVTSYGYTANCRYLGGYQRVDIGVAQEWLATFGL